MEIKVNASKRYSVVIENDLKGLKEYKDLFTGDKIAIITDSNLNNIYGNTVGKLVENKRVYHYVITAGEQSKNAENYIKILNFLAQNEFKRNDTIVAFGGGVVGDLTGFSAATYMRGINLIMIPTSLLAMVDSSVGGKTAIDLDNGKNLAGAFYQPSLVYVATDFLNTLPQREIISGMGEIVKYAFILGQLKYEDLLNGINQQLLYKCIAIKRDIVEADERECGLRKLLNLGHTVGHAIERISDYKLSHGECVLRGLKYTIEISKKLGVLSDEKAIKAYQILNCVNYDTTDLTDKDALIKYIKSDKKGKGDYIDFVVINENLLCEVKTLGIDELYQIL